MKPESLQFPDFNLLAQSTQAGILVDPFLEKFSAVRRLMAQSNHEPGIPAR